MITFSEEDLERSMFEENGIIKVNGKNVFLYDTQITIHDYRIDMVGLDEECNLYLFELKKGIIDGNAISQILAYLYRAKSVLYDSDIEINEIYCVLVGTDITKYANDSLNVLERVFYLQAIPVFELFDDNKKNITNRKDESFCSNIEYIIDLENQFKKKSK